MQTEGVRVSVNVLNKQKGAPLLFVVRQKEAVVSFQVPLIDHLTPEPIPCTNTTAR